MKTPLAFLAGAAVGALAMWLALPKSQSGSGTPAATVQSAKGRPAGEGIAPPDETMRTAKTKRLPPKADEEEAGAMILDEGEEEDSADMAEIRESMVKELAERKQRRIDERLAALKTRLNLDEAQTAKVRALLDAGDVEDDLLSKTLAGQFPIDGDEAEKKAKLDQQIEAVLKPEQAEAYGKFQQEQRGKPHRGGDGKRDGTNPEIPDVDTRSEGQGLPSAWTDCFAGGGQAGGMASRPISRFSGPGGRPGSTRFSRS